LIQAPEPADSSVAVVWIGLGSNLDDPRVNLHLALAAIGRECRIARVSSLYSTEPVGYADQGWFMNAAAEVWTTKSPRGLLAFLQHVETSLGRTRDVRFGPRTIDLDILLWGDAVIDEEGLIVPHPRMHERRFVLEPLNELAPELKHPQLGKTMAELRASCPDQARATMAEPASWFPLG
jgi:2-amino-4-hydroxy-6-hydroxymethyldihydropteridine diphosphokinase